MYPVHESPTGAFQELARKKDITFGQLSYLVIKPNCSRGNHYHKRKEEWFCCLHGKCELILTDARNNESRNMILDREFVKINPFENHVLRNLSEEEACEVLIIISEEFDPNNPDTYEVRS